MKTIDIKGCFTIGPETFTPFKLEEKNFRKFMLYYEFNGDCGESPWCWLSDEDCKKYDSNESSGEVLFAVAANQCLNGVPWGAVIPITTDGKNKPYCVMKKDIVGGSKVIFHPECKKQIEEAEAQGKQSA